MSHVYQNSDRIIIPFIRRGVQDVVTFPLHRNIYIVYVESRSRSTCNTIVCNNINFGDLSFSEIRLNERRHDIEKNLRQRAPACIGTQRIRPVCTCARPVRIYFSARPRGFRFWNIDWSTKTLPAKPKTQTHINFEFRERSIVHLPLTFHASLDRSCVKYF